MADSGVFTNIFTLIDESIIQVVLGKTGTLISVIEPLLLSGFTVYLLFLFLSYWNGSFEDSIVDFFKKVFVWILVLGFALNIGLYNEYIVPMVMNFGDYLNQKFSGGNTTINGSLDEMTVVVLEAIKETMEKASGVTGTILAVLVIFLIGVFSLIFLVISAGFILLAKVFSGILVVVGPIFIGLFLFPATRQFAMAWVNQVVNYTLLTFFLNVLMAIFVQFMVNAFGTGAVDLSRGLNIALGAGVFFVVLLRLPDLASGLAGGIASNGLMQAARITKGGLLKGQTKGTGTQGGSIKKS